MDLKIRRLPADLANQIAAGEVVERPAAVVKELVENAIDAGAGRIAITSEFGGKRLLRVEDDGEGMAPDDARLAIERHATSKIRTAEDLAAIATLGFRGEALPSIASVSRFVLRTRLRGTDAGTEIRVAAGEAETARAIGMPEGTTIEVADLFFNLPARRKFLKADAAEAAQISRTVTQLAVCYPEVGFTLVASGRRVVECPPVATLRDRLHQVYGDRPDLIEVRRDGEIRIAGYIAALAEQGPSRGPQHVFINRRIVRDRTIMHAIVDAYSIASIKERSPEVHLFLEMPLDALDVNVHPTKAEVRFRDQPHVHQVVRRAVADALGAGPAPALTLVPASVPPPQATTLPLPGGVAGVLPSRWQAFGAARTAYDALLPEGRADAAREVAVAFGATVPAAAGSPARPMIPLGQFRDTFIVAVDDDGIAIIDQHVAHERILFERITERLTAGRLESQRLLQSMLVELSAAGHDVLLARAADLDRLGFEIDSFGGTTIRLAAVPILLTREACDATVRAFAEDLDGLDRGAPAEAAIKRIAATMACHAAVKANDPLTHEKMLHLLAELRQTAHSTICPHGRPVMLRLTRREIEKNFDRI